MTSYPNAAAPFDIANASKDVRCVAAVLAMDDGLSPQDIVKMLEAGDVPTGVARKIVAVAVDFWGSNRDGLQATKKKSRTGPMSFLKKLFGSKSRNITASQPANVTERPVNCDLCNGEVLPGQGYAFYSDTQHLPGLTTGNMLICQLCADTIMTDSYWTEIKRDPALGPGSASFATLRNLSSQQIVAVPATADYRRRLDHAAIIRKCCGAGLSPKQSKDKGRELARLWWKDRTRGMEETKCFWNAS